MLKITSPQTKQELEDYYQFRWELLRKPWNYPPGSEKDEYESVGRHIMVVDNNSAIKAVGRLQFNSNDEAQVRHIAVANDSQGTGLGRMILTALEQEAKSQGASRVVTNSRENSIEFFKQCGYDIVGNAPNELGALQRQQMVKELQSGEFILRHPVWCRELQDTWHSEIPITSQMGIRVYQYTGGSFETRASLNKNVNLHGTMFAGSIYSLATLTGWGMIHLMLKEESLDGDLVLGDGNIHYHKPVTAQPRAICERSSMTCDFSYLKKGERSKIELQVQVLDRDRPVAEFKGVYWVLPKRKDS